jgi:hypothetical protein
MFKNTKNNNIKMNKYEKFLKDFFSKQVKFVAIATDTDPVYIAEDELVLGIVVYTDDALTIVKEDGEFKLEDGTVITIIDGFVGSIVPVEAEAEAEAEEEEEEEAEAKIEAAKDEQLMSKITAFMSENETLKEENKTLKSDNTDLTSEVAAMTNEIEKFKKLEIQLREDLNKKSFGKSVKDQKINEKVNVEMKSWRRK